MFEFDRYKLWIVVLLNILPVCTGQWCSSGVVRGQDCFIFPGPQVTRTWTAAERYCQGNYGGHLPSIQDSSKQSIVEALMRSRSLSSTWTGAKEAQNTHWRWAADNRIIQPQGCFNEDFNNREFTVTVAASSSDLIPVFCTTSCHLQGYKYAALQAGNLCYCGNSFGQYGTTSGCTVKCSGDSKQLCGGPRQNFVLYIAGTHAQWADGQPNNFGLYQLCAVLDSNNKNKSADEQCDRSYMYACDISSCIPESTDGEGIYVATTLLNRCYYLSYNTRSWFSARQQCLQRNGDLVELNSEFHYNELATLLVKYQRSSIRYHWIGLSKHVLQWSTGELLKYNKFKTGLPTQFTDGCVVIRSIDNYEWSDISCTTTSNFICQVNNQTLVATTSTTTTTTTTTTLPTTTTTQTTTTTTKPTTTTTETTTTTTKPTTTTTRPTTTTTKPTTTTTKPTTTTTKPTTTTTRTTTTTTKPTTASTTSQPTTTSPVTGGNPATTTRSSVTTTTTVVSNGTTISALPIAGQATGSSSNLVLTVVLVVVCAVLVLIVVCIVIAIIMRKNSAKRKTIPPGPNEIIPYDCKPEEYITSTPVFNINNSRSSLISGDTSLKNVRLGKKTTLGTQTCEQHNVYTKTFRMADSNDELDSADTERSITAALPPSGRRHNNRTVEYMSDREHHPTRRHFDHFTTAGHSRGHYDSDRESTSRRLDDSSRENIHSLRGHYDSGYEDNLPRVHSRHVRHRKNSVGHSDFESDHNLGDTKAHVATDVRWSDIDNGPVRSSIRHKKPRDLVESGTTEDFDAQAFRGRRAEYEEHPSSPDVNMRTETSVQMETDESLEPQKKKRKTKVCPECGKKIVLLRKHLINKHGMTPGSRELKDALAESKEDSQ